MVDKLTYSFPGTEKVALSQVGGKGLSLIEGERAGLPVPPGFILSVEFFEPWLTDLKKTRTWSDFLKTKESELPKLCSELKQAASKLSFSQKQQQTLEESLKSIGKDSLFAI